MDIVRVSHLQSPYPTVRPQHPAMVFPSEPRTFFSLWRWSKMLRVCGGDELYAPRQGRQSFAVVRLIPDRFMMPLAPCLTAAKASQSPSACGMPRAIRMVLPVQATSTYSPYKDASLIHQSTADYVPNVPGTSHETTEIHMLQCCSDVYLRIRTEARVL